MLFFVFSKIYLIAQLNEPAFNSVRFPNAYLQEDMSPYNNNDNGNIIKAYPDEGQALNCLTMTITNLKSYL